MSLLGLYLVLRDPVVHRRPIEVVEERVDVRRAIRLIVEEVGVLVDVKRDERRRVPDRIGVLRVADVVKEAALVPVVGRPGPAPAGHPRGLQVGPPVLERAEVTLDQVTDQSGRVASAAPKMLEVDLMVLDPADREGEVDLERANLRIDLVRSSRVDPVEPREDLVSLVDVALVELVVSLDRCAGDAVELVELGLQLPGGDLLETEGKRRHLSPLSS